MSIHRLDQDIYKISVELGTDIFGKRRRKVVTFHGSKAEAVKKESELKSKYYHSGEQKNTKNYTFRELGKLYLEHNSKNIGGSTNCLYKSYLERINQYIGDIKIKNLTTFMLDNLYQKLKEGKRSELSNRTLLNYRKFINAVFKQAVSWGFIDTNPNKNTSKIKKDGEEKSIYSIQEAKQLLNALDDEPIKYRAIIMLALDSGARKGEISALRWSDIDFDTHTMKITNSSNREVILSDTTIKVLLEYKEWQREYIKTHKDRWMGKENRVFTSLDGRYINPDICNYALAAVIRKHNLKPIPFHSLRHTCASLLLSTGVDIKTVSKRLGHANTSMTLDVYSHVLEESKNICAIKFDEIAENR